MRKCLIFISLIFVSLVTNANASSITYNLNIDKDMQFNERIVYVVSNNELAQTNKYSFLSDVVNKRIYFDKNNEIPYTKSIRKTNNGYIVTLTHSYPSIFFTRSRIANECFSKTTLDNDVKGLKFSSSSPFFCSHRADNITINITSAQNITKSNSNTKNNNTYTWNKIDKDFTMNLSTTPTELDTEPLDDVNPKNEENGSSNNNTPSNQEKDSISDYVLLGIGVAVASVGILVVIMLIKKKEELDKF